LILDIKDVVCGDPACAPVDTIFTLVWEDGGRGLFGLPYAPEEIEEADMDDLWPDVETMMKWKAGESAKWPPDPPLRFQVGDRVQCRVGPHPVKGWADGRITQLNYRQVDWPPNMVAPYQIALQDGRLIFAPQDMDQVIRARTRAEDDPPSPTYEGFDDKFEAIDNSVFAGTEDNSDEA
jgi:hypothetical protein